MRNAFADEITRLAGENPEIVMMMGDIGNRLFDKFKAANPDRFFNCGVAEANMISMAAGMAASGLRPVCYTITPFITYRVIEQIRLDLCYHKQPVVFVGTGAGLSYASLGATHHSLEEMGMLRLLPELTVLCPADQNELRGCLREALKLPGPVYMRIGKKGEPAIHETVPGITIGKGLLIREGTDVALMSAGNMLPTAIEVAKVLSAGGVETRIVSMHTLKPLDTGTVAAAFTDCKVVATIEEHSVLGGLGTAVAEWMSEHPGQTRGKGLIRFGTRDEFLHEAGEQDHARSFFHLDAGHVASRLREALKA